jgi:hypothetical protein
MAKLRGRLSLGGKSKKTKFTTKSLRKLNLAIAILFVLQVGLILVLADSNKGLVPVTTSFLTEDVLATQASGTQVLVEGSTHLFDVQLAYLLAAVLAVGAVGHLLTATWLRKRYEKNLKQNTNSIRWIQYSINIGALIVMVGLLAGVRDLSLLFAVFGLVGIANIMRILSENQNKDRKSISWTTYWIGAGAGLVNFVIFAIYAWGAEVYGSGLAMYVYFVLATALLALILMSLVMRFSYIKSGRWANYLNIDRLYATLSFLAISAITWQVFAGTLRP